jgi:hypothetical protein
MVSILSFAGGIALSVGIDMFIVGGVSGFGTAVVAAYGMTMAAYTVATAGLGLIVAGIVTGGYLLIKSNNWDHDEANIKAIELMLSSMKKGKPYLILKINALWEEQIQFVKNQLNQYKIA